MCDVPDRRKKWLTGFADEMDRIEKVVPFNFFPSDAKYPAWVEKVEREMAFGALAGGEIEEGLGSDVLQTNGSRIGASMRHYGLDARIPEDKGARLVRYSKRANRVGVRFAWNSVGAFMWRLKLGAFCGVLRLTPDNYKVVLAEWFGRNWVYALRPVIESIKPVEFHPDAESKASLRHAWIVAMNERERRLHRRQRKEERP